jgi:hypothetical protein
MFGLVRKEVAAASQRATNQRRHCSKIVAFPTEFNKQLLCLLNIIETRTELF